MKTFDAKISLAILTLILLSSFGCAAKRPPITLYEPPRCPNYIWTELALDQLSDLYLINQLLQHNHLSLIYDTESGMAIDLRVDLVLQNIGEYNKHCNAIDAYLDSVKN